MGVKIVDYCTVCDTIKREGGPTRSRLVKLIFKTAKYSPGSKISLKDVHREYNDCFTYNALGRHCIHHQSLDESAMASHHLRQLTADMQKKLIAKNLQAADVWQRVIDEGVRNIEEGKTEVNVSHLLKAVKDKTDYEVKQTSQKQALMEMVWFFTSGEELPGGVKENDRVIEGEAITTDVVDDPQERERRSRSFYQSLIGDATAPGPN